MKDIEINPMEKLNKIQIKLIMIGLSVCIFVSCMLSTSIIWFLILSVILSFLLGQFYFVYVNWDDLKKINYEE